MSGRIAQQDKAKQISSQSKKAENGWKPESISEDEKSLVIFKKFRSSLNKITVTNFKVIFDEIKLLEIDTQSRLDGCVKMVFEKAISERLFTELYLLLCKEMSSFIVVDAGSRRLMFKNRLITICQLEFEKQRDSEIVKYKKQSLEEIENEDDPIKKKALKTTFEEENSKLRYRAVGAVHILGELFKLKMLNRKIMVFCMNLLMDPSLCSEETLECLCKLLSIIGKQYDEEAKYENDLTLRCMALKRIVAKKDFNDLQISSRVRFMIQDVVDLRLNNWIPRHVEVKPWIIVRNNEKKI
ncbi:unnamed protein product [Diamesa serratosioi]